MEIKEVERVLSEVVHPEFDRNIVELGMVENLRIDSDGTGIRFNLVFPRADAMAGSIKNEIREHLGLAFGNVNIAITEIIRAKKVTKKNINDLGNEQLARVNNIIAVASGKGGVGKSTVTVNLAVALANAGYKVGVVDADIYGPSIPKMTATEGFMPQAQEGTELIIPNEKYGIKWMSVGYFVDPSQALIWRGPMACNALKQIILQTKWDELDFLLLDMPPGTGDIHITLVQDIPVSGAIVVTTPQDVALADVEKGINLFRNKDVNKKILGIVENMSWFTPAELPNNRYYIFGRGGAQKMAGKYNVPLLGQIPLVQSIRECGDSGAPSALNVNSDQTFKDLAEAVASQVL